MRKYFSTKNFSTLIFLCTFALLIVGSVFITTPYSANIKL